MKPWKGRVHRALCEKRCFTRTAFVGAKGEKREERQEKLADSERTRREVPTRRKGDWKVGRVVTLLIVIEKAVFEFFSPRNAPFEAPWREVCAVRSPWKEVRRLRAESFYDLRLRRQKYDQDVEIARRCSPESSMTLSSGRKQLER
ncbi:hypothetical protein KM043_018133 [Ampulex compressa]|nr:hypothetical protein KM043_018133 [Ampulex compressa]